ncbi:uncharacterized protein LOC143883059 [Tasmannia lanceolata]|uniref:uncharacterized protein LOC143883059 n=1 Tax=Tasmannia lanceolata TaxID=3420 RepID=UPI00406489B4
MADFDNHRQILGNIDIISGGLAAGGPTTAGRKAYLTRVNSLEAPAKKLKPEGDSIGQVITFTEADYKGVTVPHDDAVVIRLVVANFNVSKILVNTGSSINILHSNSFDQMGISIDRLTPVEWSVYGFSGDSVKVDRQIDLPVTFGTDKCQRMLMQTFLVVQVPSTYNMIIGRPALNELQAVVSTPHLKMKFPTHGIGVICGDQDQARSCYYCGLKGKIKMDLIDFLQVNMDVFAWLASDMPGISPEVIVHKLTVDTSFKPVKQKKMNFALERQVHIKEEVDKLLKANFIEEIHYPEWLANVVMVKKANGATYQRLVNRLFQNQTSRNIEVYVDDMLVKSMLAENHISDLEETFAVLRKGIEANPEKIKAILDMTPPRNIVELPRQRSVQSWLVRRRNVSRVLHDAETRYQNIEKFAYALVVSARKLRPYFQAHTIVLLTDQPLRKILQKPDTSGRLITWVVELGEFDIQVHSRHSIKSQVLVDFIVEWSVPTQDSGGGGGGQEGEVEAPKNPLVIPPSNPWMLYVDGAANVGGCGAGLVLVGPDSFLVQYAIKLEFKASNNETEYEALLSGLDLAIEMNADCLRVHSDSQLIVGQVNGLCEAKELKMMKVDALSNMAASDITDVGTVYLEKEARRLIAKAAQYIFDGKNLYKRSYSWPYLKCLRPPQTKYALREVHEGICGDNSGGMVLAKKILSQPYAAYTPVSSLVSFAMLGMDLLGPFPQSKGGFTMRYVEIDYFTKWVEAKAVVKADSKATKKFVYHDIVCRFEIPGVLVTDNGTNSLASILRTSLKGWGLNRDFLQWATRKLLELVL